MNRHPTISVGDRFGLWEVLELGVKYSGQRRGNNVHDLARCTGCGLERPVARGSLRYGLSKSCGRYPCYLQAGNSQRGNPDWKRHGLSAHPLYTTWKNLRSATKKSSPLPNMAGVPFHEPWNDFKVFFDYVEMNLGPCPGTWAITRIDRSSGYEPGNIRWSRGKTDRSRRRRDGIDYKKYGPAKEPPQDRLRKVSVPPHLREKGWTE